MHNANKCVAMKTRSVAAKLKSKQTQRSQNVRSAKSKLPNAAKPSSKRAWRPESAKLQGDSRLRGMEVCSQ